MKAPGAGLKREIGVLHALGDALEAPGRADVVIVEQLLEIVEGDVGINRHVPALPLGGLLRYIPAARAGF